jgi:hypothetical protein
MSHRLEALLYETRKLHEASAACMEFGAWPADLIPNNFEPRYFPVADLVQSEILPGSGE